jgi:fused signal recognition particle receptor
MFGFLKDKLKGALGKLTREVEKDAVIEKKEILVEKKPDVKREDGSGTDKNKKIIEKAKKDDVPKIVEQKKKGFFQKIFGKKDEEEIIQEKEDLQQRAEKVIREPEYKKEAIKQSVSDRIPVVREEKPTEAIKDITIETKKDITTATKKVIPEFTKTHEASVSKLASDSEIKDLKVSDKIDVHIPKPHHQAIEEERSKKVVQPTMVEEEHKGFFTKITETFTKIQLTEEKFDELFWELEVVLLENNVAVEVIDKIKRDLKKELLAGKVSRKGVEELIISTLRDSIMDLFDVEKINLIDRIKEKRKSNQPYIIAVIGVNGSGKTTSIAKLTHKFQKEGLSVVLAASDTFRAAAIQQLEEHANRLNVKIVKHDYNSDPAAVAFDAIKYAEAKDIDVVIIDTAGRLHSNTNLMRELEKVIRVCKPDIKIFVGESITGNDCVEQAKEFDNAVGIDAIILAKADVDEKGGAAISVSYILQRPILYLGTGQTYDDLKEFDSKLILDSLEL